MKQLLIGGQALRELGSDRHTEDRDYLVNDTSTRETFIHGKEGDFCNANGNAFFADVWVAEEKNEGPLASPQAIFELKAYSFTQHCENFNFEKADQAEYDMKFLVRNYGVREFPIAAHYISAGAISTIEKIIKSVKG